MRGFQGMAINSLELIQLGQTGLCQQSRSNLDNFNYVFQVSKRFVCHANTLREVLSSVSC